MLSGQSMQAGRWCGDACIRSSGEVWRSSGVNPSGLIMVSRFPGGCWQYDKRRRANSTSGDVQAILFYFLLVLLFAYAVVRVVKVCILVKRSGWIQAEKSKRIFSRLSGSFFLSASGSVIFSGSACCIGCQGLPGCRTWQFDSTSASVPASWILLIIHLQFFADALTVNRSGGQADIYWCRYSIMVCVI